MVSKLFLCVYNTVKSIFLLACAKLLILAGVITIFFGLTSQFSKAESFVRIFNDIQNHYAESAIFSMQNQCRFTGYPTASRAIFEFRPDSPITRAELVQIIIGCNFSNIPYPTFDNFRDVIAADWFYSSVNAAKELDWISGYTDGTFKPNKLTTRAEGLAIILRSKFSVEEIDVIASQFADVSETQWYYSIINFAYSRGYVSGYRHSDGTLTGLFGPNDTITRAEVMVILARMKNVQADDGGFPATGGILETVTTAIIRPIFSNAQIENFIPARGKFIFPAPYNSTGIRLTNETDCGGQNCVYPVGYSYWRNINNHTNSDHILIFLGLSSEKGGKGPSLFKVDKQTGLVTNLGPLFSPNSNFFYHTTEGWYFSATDPDILYVFEGSTMYRYNVVDKSFETVFDIQTYYSDTFIWQMHSSNDDNVHSATLKSATTYESLGCVVYIEDQQDINFYERQGNFDECQIDKSGEWLLIKENVDSKYEEDNRIINVKNGTEKVLLDENGNAGHSDMGFGYMVGADNFDLHPNAIKIWNFAQGLITEKLVHYNIGWDAPSPNHISHTNSKDNVPIEDQYACGSSVSRINILRSNEIICFRLDGSLKVLTIAPVMTNLDTGGGNDDYENSPKGNLDITGEYFIWTSNMGTNRLDAFLVKIPKDKLFDYVQ